MITLTALKAAAKLAFPTLRYGTAATVWDVTLPAGTAAVVVATGRGYHLQVSGHSKREARKHTLELLERLGPDACEVCKDVLEAAPKRCEKHDGDVSDYEVES